MLKVGDNYKSRLNLNCNIGNVVPTVHSLAPTSPSIEANIIVSYFANHNFIRHPVCVILLKYHLMNV